MPGVMNPADLMIIRKLSKWYCLTICSSARSSLSYAIGIRSSSTLRVSGSRPDSSLTMLDALPRLKPTSPATRMTSPYAGS